MTDTIDLFEKWAILAEDMGDLAALEYIKDTVGIFEYYQLKNYLIKKHILTI